MLINFPRYLKSKKFLDQRSRSHFVYSRLLELIDLKQSPLKTFELGGGIGDMFLNLLDACEKVEFNYVLVDSSAANITYLVENIETWGREKQCDISRTGQSQYEFTRENKTSRLSAFGGTVENFVQVRPENNSFQLVIAASYLDIVSVPRTLQLVNSIVDPDALFYLPFNYDGLTFFHPTIDTALDGEITRLYNASMNFTGFDKLESGGDLTGRKLLDWLPQAGWKTEAVGASDWFVFPTRGTYQGDEAYFLNCIIQFVEESVGRLWEGSKDIFDNWLAARRRQIEDGELSYMAHQVDYLARR